MYDAFSITCMMLCSMDDRTGKHSVKDLRTYAQQTTVNIYVGRVEKLSSGIFLLLVSTTEK